MQYLSEKGGHWTRPSRYFNKGKLVNALTLKRPEQDPEEMGQQSGVLRE